MHLHVREAAEKLEEAQADITRRVVVIARKETVKIHNFVDYGEIQPERMFLELFACPSPILAVLTC